MYLSFPIDKLVDYTDVCVMNYSLLALFLPIIIIIIYYCSIKNVSYRYLLLLNVDYNVNLHICARVVSLDVLINY